MLLGIYGDPHITKNMRSFQDIWDTTAKKSIHHMYNKFDELSVEAVVCLGDFFDAPRIEAKSMQLVLPILDDINSRSYPTYILLGNHEADSTESNILEYLNTYENIVPITNTLDIEDMTFIPYFDDPNLYDLSMSNVVFTHHDIYGSSLAAGKTKAFFGLDTEIFKEAKLVINGHVHLKSKVNDNIINAGSLLVSQQGELRVGEYPSYYTLDTKSGDLSTFDNKHSMIYLSISEEELDKVSIYDKGHLVLRVDYNGEIPDEFQKALHVSWRKIVGSIDSKEESVSTSSNFDMKNYLVEYLKKDQDIPEAERDEYMSTGLRLLS